MSKSPSAEFTREKREDIMPYKNTSLCAAQKQSYSIKWPLFAKMSAVISLVALFTSFAVMCVIKFMQFELDRVLCLSIVTLAVAVVGIVFASFAMHADKKNNKKLKGAGATAIIAIILVLATSLAGATVGFLQVQTYGDGIYESISNGDGTCSLKLVNPAAQKLLYEKSGELEIPSNFNGEVVTSIQDLDFHNSIHKVTIPASVASIGESFSGNNNLTEIVFENNSNIGELCDNAFSDCVNLQKISFGEDSALSQIGDSAFYGCKSLTSITIPDNVTTIGTNAFANCNGLVTVSFKNDSNLVIIGDRAFLGCSSLTNVILPEGVAEIGDFAFDSCDHLLSVGISSGLISVGDTIFSNCPMLDVINFDGNMELWSDVIKRADLGKSFDQYLISFTPEADELAYAISPINNVAVIMGIGNFSGNHLVIPATFNELPITRIYRNAFSGVSQIDSLTIKNKTLHIDDEAFINCSNLKNVFLQNNDLSIGNGAFGGCVGIEKVVGDSHNTSIVLQQAMPASVSVDINTGTEIEKDAFKGVVGLNSIVLADSIVSIEDGAFKDCSELTAISLPNAVAKIHSNAFDGCNKLATVTGTTNSVDMLIDLICPSVVSVILTGGNRIEDYTFSNCKQLENVSIANSVVSIGDNAFENCTALKSINIPQNVVDIGNDAFSNCTTLENVELPNSVKTIGERAFMNCTSLASIDLPNGLKSIGEYAFNNCKKISSIVIPDSVKIIASHSFENCIEMESLIIGNNVTQIGDFAFTDCASLNTITFPDCVETIGEGAFGSCTSLEELSFPNSISAIGRDAFYGCTKLETITIPTELTTIGQGAFYNCSKLVAIEYCGALSQWSSIVKNQWWDVNTGEYVVRCTDGYTGYPGLGTAESPFNIYMPEDLKNVNQNLSAHYRLAKDIDLTGIEWDPIGYANNEYKKFTGNFNGNGHTIKGLTRRTSPIMVGVDAYVGLFAIIENATISGIKFESVDILFPNVNKNPSYVYVGALAGRANSCSVEKISVSGKLQGGWDYSCAQDEYIGGVLGSANETTIRYCSNRADILGYHWSIWAGGILGFCQGKDVVIEYCYSVAYIEIGTGYKIGAFTGAAGGIVGCVNGKNTTVSVSNCYSYGHIKNYNGYHRDIGGIVATATGSGNSSTIRNNYYCIKAKYSSGSGNFDDTIYEVKNAQKEGNRVTEKQILSGNQIGTLFIYDANNIKLNPGYCWVYKNGEPPKLFWE